MVEGAFARLSNGMAGEKNICLARKSEERVGIVHSNGQKRKSPNEKFCRLPVVHYLTENKSVQITKMEGSVILQATL